LALVQSANLQAFVVYQRHSRMSATNDATYGRLFDRKTAIDLKPMGDGNRGQEQRPVSARTQLFFSGSWRLSKV
jgi:hypothetical protein